VEASGFILIEQLKSHVDHEYRIEIAKAILEAANKASECLLKPFGIEYAPKLEADSIGRLLLAEARARKEYYTLLDTILPPYWSIVTRSRRPPRRPADAVLSFVNGLIYAKMAGWIYRAGLDPRISYLHGEMRANNPLALDLAEIMKAPLAESILLEVAASGVEKSIITKVGDGVYLNEKGRKTIIRFLEMYMKKYIRPLDWDRQDTVEMWGQTIPRKLHRAIVENKLPNFPVIPCTLSSSTMQTLQKERISVPY